MTDKQCGRRDGNSNDNDNNYVGDQKQLSWRDDLWRRTRPYQGRGTNETENIHGGLGNIPYDGTDQRTIRKPAYLKDYVHWAGDETLNNAFKA